jgi:DNA-binding CsgD family transcriptional regulator
MEPTALMPVTPLTRREIEVVELVAQGRSNLGIAECLFISRRTVESHVINIRRKLGLANRYELMAWVYRAEGLATVTSDVH